MHPHLKPSLAACLFLVATILPVGKLSADIVYADVFGTTVSFRQIQETTTGVSPIFGQPVASGDTAISPGTGYTSMSVDGEAEMVDGRLQMEILANPGYLISSLTVRVLGSYFTIPAGAVAAAHTSAIAVTDSGSFSDSMLFLETAQSSGVHDGQFTISFPDTDRVVLSLDHVLFTAAMPGAAAFVDSSSIQIGVLTTLAVPEPSRAAMIAILSGAISIAGFRRRRT